MFKILLSLSLISALLPGWDIFKNEKELPVVSITKIYLDPEEIEPSGIEYDLTTKRIVVVSDEGKIVSVDSETFQPEIFYPLKNMDLEGISFHPKFSNLIFAVEEGKDNILVFNKKGVLLSKCNVNRKFRGKKVLSKKGNGLESITFFKEDGDYSYFFIANQSDDFSGKDRSAILLVKTLTSNIANNILGDASIVSYYPQNIEDISGMTYHNNYLFVISDTNNYLFIFNDKLEMLDSFLIPGEDQEGIVFDGHTMYIAQDSGGLLKVVIDKDRFPYLGN